METDIMIVFLNIPRLRAHATLLRETFFCLFPEKQRQQILHVRANEETSLRKPVLRNVSATKFLVCEDL